MWRDNSILKKQVMAQAMNTIDNTNTYNDLAKLLQDEGSRPAINQHPLDWDINPRDVHSAKTSLERNRRSVFRPMRNPPSSQQPHMGTIHCRNTAKIMTGPQALSQMDFSVAFTEAAHRCQSREMLETYLPNHQGLREFITRKRLPIGTALDFKRGNRRNCTPRRLNLGRTTRSMGHKEDLENFPARCRNNQRTGGSIPF
jgi:hypothetical protein